MADDPNDDDNDQANKNQALRSRATASQSAQQQRDSAQGYQSMLARTPSGEARRAYIKKLYGTPDPADDN